ncbi:jg2976, partial [Pararge aegeria aegeria]
KAGNESVAPLVLQMFMSGGDHLTSGDPLARLPAINIKKKKKRSRFSSIRKYFPNFDMRGSNRRAVIFPENLLSLPQRVENMIAAVQHRLDRSVKDPSGPISAPQSLPAKAQMSDANITFNKG